MRLGGTAGLPAVSARLASRRENAAQTRPAPIAFPRVTQYPTNIRSRAIGKEHCWQASRATRPPWVKATFDSVLPTILRPVTEAGFVLLPKRWSAKGSFAWPVRYRRHNKDYERTTKSSEAMISISMIRLMSRRLAHAKT
jgi:transposase